MTRDVPAALAESVERAEGELRFVQVLPTPTRALAGAVVGAIPAVVCAVFGGLLVCVDPIGLSLMVLSLPVLILSLLGWAAFRTHPVSCRVTADALFLGTERIPWRRGARLRLSGDPVQGTAALELLGGRAIVRSWSRVHVEGAVWTVDTVRWFGEAVATIADMTLEDQLDATEVWEAAAVKRVELRRERRARRGRGDGYDMSPYQNAAATRPALEVSLDGADLRLRGGIPMLVIGTRVTSYNSGQALRLDTKGLTVGARTERWASIEGFALTFERRRTQRGWTVDGKLFADIGGGRRWLLASRPVGSHDWTSSVSQKSQCPAGLMHGALEILEDARLSDASQQGSADEIPTSLRAMVPETH